MSFFTLQVIYAYMRASMRYHNAQLFSIGINPDLLLYMWCDAGQWPLYTSEYDDLCLRAFKKHCTDVLYLSMRTVDAAIRCSVDSLNAETLCALSFPFDASFRNAFLERLLTDTTYETIMVLCPTIIHCVHYFSMTGLSKRIRIIDCPTLFRTLITCDVTNWVVIIDHAEINNVMYSVLKEMLSRMCKYLIYIRYRYVHDNVRRSAVMFAGYSPIITNCIPPVIAHYVDLPHDTRLLDNKTRAVPHVDDNGIFNMTSRIALEHELIDNDCSVISISSVAEELGGSRQFVGMDCYTALKWAILTIVGIYEDNKVLARIIWSDALFNCKVTSNAIVRLIVPSKIIDISTTYNIRTRFYNYLTVKQFRCDYYNGIQFEITNTLKENVIVSAYMCIEQCDTSDAICYMICTRSPPYHATRTYNIDISYPFYNYIHSMSQHRLYTAVRFVMNPVVCGRIESIGDEQRTGLAMVYYMLVIRVFAEWYHASLSDRYKSDKALLHHLIRYIKNY